MYRVKKLRDKMLFSDRQDFMAELRPFTNNNKSRIAHPDALFHVKSKDIERAFAATTYT